jgi:tetratricopeptide (TPR) repeat protein
MAPTREIEKLQRRWQENPLGLTFAPLAEAYRKEGMFADALDLLDIGLSQHPNYVPAHIVRGRCFLDTSQEGDAEAAFSRVTELDPDNAIALKELADIAERAGRFQEAEARLERLLEFDRSNEDALVQLDRIKSELATPRPSIDLPPPVAVSPVVAPAPAPAFAETQVPLTPPRPVEPEPQRAEILAPHVPVSSFQPMDLGSTAAPAREVPNEPVRPEPGPEPELVSPPDPAPVAEPASPFVVHASEAAFELDPRFAEPEPEPWPDSPPPVPLEAETATRPEAPPPPAPAAGTDHAPEPELSDGPAELEAGDPDLVVTETMAEIFLRQGHRELALAVYSQLLTRDPSNGRIRAAADRLEGEIRPAGGAPAFPVYAAVLTGGQSVRSFFESLLGATRPGAARSSGPLSLGAVFGDDRAAAAVEAPAAAGSESFDEFFGGEPAPVSEPLPPGPAQPTPDPVEDIEDFNSWLKGLKR